MTVKLAFHNDVDKIQLNAVNAFDQLANYWGLDGWICIDLHGEYVSRGNPYACVNLQHAIDNHPDHQFIYLLEADETPEGWTQVQLPDFVHPADNLIYVVGSNITSLDHEEMSQQNNSLVVSVETPEPVTSRPMFSYDAAFAALYDRFIKSRLNL